MSASGSLEASAGTRPTSAGDFPLIFEKSHPERRAWSLPEANVDAPELDDLIPEEHRRPA
ncbi:MAG: hypothetical protein QOC87_737, partial [Actinomycetota bacterium]|nr:hypothetical protein [Actinomycetota bacterium]